MMTAVLERPPAVVVLPVEGVGKTKCDPPSQGGCGHARNQHSAIGCIYREDPAGPECGCPVTYMAL